MKEVTEVADLPEWARDIIKESELTRMAAFFYRHQAVAFRKALHDLSSDDPRGLAFYDSVCKASANIFDSLEKMRSEEELKICDEVCKNVIKEVNGMIREKNKNAGKGVK